MQRAFFKYLCLVLCIVVGILPTQAQAPDELLDKVWKKLGADQPIEWLPVRLRLHVSDKPEVNAWTTPTTGDVYISQQMLSLIGSSEGELAFILGHEIGHVVGYWTGLSTQAQKQQMESELGSFLSILGLLFESGEDRKNRYSHIEEKLADSIALYIIKEVGYNPYDAAAFFGRLQMYSGTTDPLTRLWNPYVSTHPFKEDRIENLRRVMQVLEEEKAELADNERSAVGSLKTLVSQAVSYSSTHPDIGFPPSLADMGPAGDYLIDQELAAGLKSGYRFIYRVRSSGRGDHFDRFSIITRPITYGRTGRRSFFTDESGVIRFTTEDRPATSRDAPLQPESESTQRREEVAYIWIGKFGITFETADGQQHVLETVDALGIYSEEDFRLAEALEVEARREIIRRFMLQKYVGQVVRVLDVTLKGIERRVFEEEPERK